MKSGDYLIGLFLPHIIIWIRAQLSIFFVEIETIYKKLFIFNSYSSFC